LIAFQKEHPELPSVGNTPNRKLMKAWQRAREAAELEDAKKVSPEYAAIVERFHRTRVISTTPPRKRRSKKIWPPE
jgi:hypothetical protein